MVRRGIAGMCVVQTDQCTCRFRSTLVAVLRCDCRIYHQLNSGVSTRLWFDYIFVLSCSIVDDML